MTLVRRLARPLLAATFLKEGVDTLRDPAPRVAAAQDVVGKATEAVPSLPQDTELLVKVNAGVQVAGGLLLATGRMPRLAALMLAVSLVPTALAEQQFWQDGGEGTGVGWPSADDQQEGGSPQDRSAHTHLLKDLGLLGGLLLAAVDTEGRPGLAWRAQHAAVGAGASAKRTARSARREAARARKRLPA